MPSFKYVLALLLLSPFVHSLPASAAADAPTVNVSPRLRNDPETLLGRRYVVQNRPPLVVSDDATSNPSLPRARPPHQTASRRSARFAKYLAERAATASAERVQTANGTVVDNYVSDVNPGPGTSTMEVTKTGNTEIDEETTPVAPASYRTYNTSVTLVPRPSESAHPKSSKVEKQKDKHAKSV